MKLSEGFKASDTKIKLTAMRVKKIQIPIYYGYLHIIVTSGGMQCVKERYGLKENVENYGAFVWSNYIGGVSQYYISIDEGVKGDLLVHEIIHLVNAVFIHIGASLDVHNDEPQAYLAGWFFKEIEKYLQAK